MSRRHSSRVLLSANLVPLVGVVWLGWDVLGILLLYWTESIVIGVVNILRMASCESRGALGDMMPAAHMEQTERIRYNSLPGLPSNAVKLFLIPFFIVHYGMFCFAHLAAIIALFGPSGLSRELDDSIPELWHASYWLAIAAIAASHLYSYFVNFLGKGEYRQVNLMNLMQRPYGRIIVMHLSIIVGGALVVRLGSPLPMLLILVGAKIWLDLTLHEKERVQLAGDARNTIGQ